VADCLCGQLCVRQIQEGYLCRSALCETNRRSQLESKDVMSCLVFHACNVRIYACQCTNIRVIVYSTKLIFYFSCTICSSIIGHNAQFYCTEQCICIGARLLCEAPCGYPAERFLANRYI